jgi:diamine N-acetyltransferase
MAVRHPKHEVLGCLSSGRIIAMRAMDPSAAVALARTFAAIEPWSRLGSTASALTQTLTAGRLARSWCLTVDSEPAGAMVVQETWLRGPYLTLLAVVPHWQRQGLARMVLDWWEADARSARAANLWLCVSDFNVPAQHCYEAFGFRAAGRLDGLLVEGLSEILMRKRL